MEEQYVYYSYRDTNGEAQHYKCSIKEAEELLGRLMTKYSKLLVIIKELNELKNP